MRERERVCVYEQTLGVAVWKEKVDSSMPTFVVTQHRKMVESALRFIDC